MVINVSQQVSLLVWLCHLQWLSHVFLGGVVCRESRPPRDGLSQAFPHNPLHAGFNQC